ncbi:helix-turn-helix domain-containing protein [Thermodesulfobacteriota bacterium]
MNEKVLIHSIRGQKNEPRNLVIYLARRHSGLSLAEIGSEFGLRKYSSVSSIVMRTEHLMSQSKQLQKKAENVRVNCTRVKQRLDRMP